MSIFPSWIKHLDVLCLLFANILASQSKYVCYTQVMICTTGTTGVRQLTFVLYWQESTTSVRLLTTMTIVLYWQESTTCVRWLILILYCHENTMCVRWLTFVLTGDFYLCQMTDLYFVLWRGYHLCQTTDFYIVLWRGYHLCQRYHLGSQESMICIRRLTFVLYWQESTIWVK